MKFKNLIRLLLGSFLLVLANQKCAALTVTVTGCGSDIGATASLDSEGDSTASSIASYPLPNWNYSTPPLTAYDGSEISARQRTTFDDNDFFGSGLLTTTFSFADALYGYTGTYVTFTVDSPAHYVLRTASSQSDGLDNEVYVVFEGEYFTDGLQSGTLIPGRTYSLMAGDTGPSSSAAYLGSWTYDMSITPITVPIKIAEAQKTTFSEEYNSLEGVVASLAAQLNALPPNSPKVSAFQQVLAHDTELAANLLTQILDPVDTNYTVLAQAAPPPVVPVPAGATLSQASANCFNAWLTNLSLASGFSTAFSTSINRAEGADVVGNSYWDTRQMSAAVQFEAQLAAVLDQEPVFRSNLVGQLDADGFTTSTVTTNDAIAFQSEVATNGLPSALLNGLIALGADGDTITNLQNAILFADPGLMAGSFPQILTDTNLDFTQHAAGASLRDSSLMLINASLLPGGQFRFDLPTEPGYTYQIQFTQTPGNASSWATILTNNAAAALLSVTNKPIQSAQTGFYRALHF
jgi:hypothetical protein